MLGPEGVEESDADWGKRIELETAPVNSQSSRDWSNSIASRLIEWLLTVSLMILLTLASNRPYFDQFNCQFVSLMKVGRFQAGTQIFSGFEGFYYVPSG